MPITAESLPDPLQTCSTKASPIQLVVGAHMGLEQFAQEEAVLWEEGPPVSSHSKLLPPSSEVNSNATDDDAETDPGEAIIVAEGPAVSMVTCINPALA